MHACAPAPPSRPGQLKCDGLLGAGAWADAAAVIKNLDNLKFYGQRLSVQHELLAGQELDNFMIAEKMLH